MTALTDEQERRVAEIADQYFTDHAFDKADSSGTCTRLQKRRMLTWFLVYALPVIGFVFTRPTTCLLVSVGAAASHA